MAKYKLAQWLEEGRIIMGDGAMGTMLQDAGLTDGGAPELWNVERPEAIADIHRAYAAAGAEIVTTNTFGGTTARLKMHDLEDRVYELNKAGAEVARAVADEFGALVAGDIGPSGELIEPVGPLSMDEAVAIFAEQVQGLVDGGVDFILIETMSHLNEVEAAIRGARQIDAEIPVVATMSFDTNYRTMMGVTPQAAVEAIAGMGALAIGANCGNGPAEIELVMTQMAQHRPQGVYLMAQSNAGLPQFVGDEIKYDGTPEIMAQNALKSRSLGINYIGACCGSTPEHIAAMRAALDAAKADPIPGPPAPEAEATAAPSGGARQGRRARRPRSG
jgi:methionine synthase I (cobalamin-dependent)